MLEMQTVLSRLAEGTEQYRQMLAANRYPVNFRDQRQGVEAVLLPLGSDEAIERLLRDVEAFGFGMGEAGASSAGLEWLDRCKAAQAKLREHIAFIRKLSVLRDKE